MPRLSITVSGRVQGVGYRAFTAELAGRLNIGGTVQNLADGRVQIIADGDRHALDAFIAHCRQGPAAARVDGLAISELAADAPLPGFRVLR